MESSAALTRPWYCRNAGSKEEAAKQMINVEMHVNRGPMYLSLLVTKDYVSLFSSYRIGYIFAKKIRATTTMTTCVCRCMCVCVGGFLEKEAEERGEKPL